MDTKLPTTPNVDELIVAIQALRPVRNQAEEEFARIYPAIKERLAKGVTQKAIREALAMKGFKLHPQKFKKMLTAEEARQSQFPRATTLLKHLQVEAGGKQ